MQNTFVWGKIDAYRNRLLALETEDVLGSRKPSTRVRNAFGARYFQPHLAFLHAGSRIDRDLTKIGTVFRESIPYLTFDRFTIEIVARDAFGGRRSQA